jgi:hypothetical protein
MDMDTFNIADVFAFYKEFNLVGSTESLPGRNKGKKICRFCNKSEGEVSFRNKSHAVPELLGRNDFIIFDECDKCNSFFSDWENQLGQFFRPYLAIIGIKGKRDQTEFRARARNNNSTSLKMERSGKINLKIDLDDDIKIDEENEHITIRFRQPPISRLYVYKSLVKIALSLLPKNNVNDYRNLFEWLADHRNSSVPCIPAACITVLRKVKWDKPVAELYKSNRIEGKEEIELFSRFTMVIRFANLVVQIFLLPTMGKESIENDPPNFQSSLFPAFLQDHVLDKDLIAQLDPKTRVEIPFNYTIEDLSNEEAEERDEVIELTYQSRI